jgi:hypothetical protein
MLRAVAPRAPGVVHPTAEPPMKSHPLVAALAALALAPASFAQESEPSLLRPLATDFYFHENEDGSIVAADARGTYYFADWQVYLDSPFFQEHGMRCGTDRIALPLSLMPTSDCSSSNTNPAAQYDPATGADYLIPVVFHVLRRTNGTNDVSDARIAQQMDVLNEDFGAFGAGLPGTNTRIQFTLAGVTRSNNDTWYNDGGSYYNTLAWDTDEYLNIYTNNAGGNLGYAFIPSGGGVVGNNFDRVVVLHSTVGRPAPYGSPYHLGRSATHEVGPYLGLYHTFQGGCTSPSGCFNNGDLICDTNPEASPNFSPCTRTTCGSPDPTRNYMDYSDDVCMNNFTPNQAFRMRCTLENFRVDLADTSLPLPGPATGPNPLDGKIDLSIDADLAWTAGSNTDSHDVYFGTNASPGVGEFQGNQVGTTFDPGTLANGTTFYWRIDEVNATGTTTGAVWSFTTEEVLAPPLPASAPTPLDGAVDVPRNAILAWTAGAGSASHDVYFGTTNPPPFAGNQAGTSFAPGVMAKQTTYFWRIDEVNTQGTTAGTVWSFTTGRNLSRKQL